MTHGRIYYQRDILRIFKDASDEQRAEALESLGSLVSSGRVVRTYAKGIFSYVKAPQSVIDDIDAKELAPRVAREIPKGNYESYASDLGSHMRLAMLARGNN